MSYEKSAKGRRQRREHRERYYLPAPPDSERENRAWTADEDAMVAAGGMPLRDLAAALGRSMKAVEGRRTILRKRYAGGVANG